MKLTYTQIQQNIANLANRQHYAADFLYELLAAYGRSVSSITQLRQGALNKSEEENAVLQKDVVYFKTFPKGTILEDEIENLKNDPLTQRFRPRYLISTDLIEIRAQDTKKNTTLARKIADIDKDIAFFYGWTGDEITDSKTEATADRRVAEKMNQLYVEIEKVNFVKFAKEGSTFRHDLNVFFTRLLFCFFAEDTGLFKEKQFADGVKDFSNLDGSDLNAFFVYLFKALDSRDKADLSTPFSDFPYVNGSIFNTSKHGIVVPDFNAQARHLLLECAQSDWGDINPDIFGTMFQGIVDPDKRDHYGMDYTSVPNIMKVIEPLFLDGLHERFDEIYNSPNQLRELLSRVRNIKVFDPACGSGNFLIIAYKQLRLLENGILERMDQLKGMRRTKKHLPSPELFESGVTAGENSQIYSSEISLNNFYGIEIDDLAHEMAILSLYIAKHQMDSEFEKQFPVKLPHLPLIENKRIIKGNAAREDWNLVCANNGTDEIYLIGNPPYKGAKLQTIAQKKDFLHIFGDAKFNKNLDYISLWFIKGARYISRTNAKLAFVSTNSITQGEQVANLWPYIYENEVEIFFAHTSFKWNNLAANAAGVTCVIVGLTTHHNRASKKSIFTQESLMTANNINAYLFDGSDLIVSSRTTQLSTDLPDMEYGNMPLDGNFLKLDEDSRNAIIAENASSAKYIRPLVGGRGLVDGIDRWCLWIETADRNDAEMNSIIKERIQQCKNFREAGGDVARTLVSRPHQFRYRKMAVSSMIIMPCTTTDGRKYIPGAVYDANYITDNSLQVIYDSPLFVFSLIESAMHMAWIRTVCGQLETRIRYSTTLGYNTFPLPPLTDVQKGKLKASARKILLTRESHSEKTLAQMYDSDEMPEDLRQAHYENDILVDSIYRTRGFANDEDRLAMLFQLYEQMVVKRT